MLEYLKEFLKSFDIEKIREIEEKIDEQYKALEILYKNIKRKDSFPLLVILNAIVSYQLNKRGEEYWWDFSKYFSSIEFENEFDAMIDFIKRFNKRFLRAKIKRIEKLRPYGDFIKERYEHFYENMVELRDFLSNVLNQNKNAKTIVFAVKMFGYAMRIKTGRFVPYPFEIAIPVDSRIKRITEKITNENPVKFWFKISEEVGIPPLHLDSILWNLIAKCL